MELTLGSPDPRVRRFVAPTRVLWTSKHGVTNPEYALTGGDDVCILRTETVGDPASILFDFGTELNGGVRFDLLPSSVNKKVRVRIRFGESATEAMSDPNNDHAIHDFETHLPWWGHAEIGNTGFRFVRLDLLETGVDLPLKMARAVAIYRPLDYLGTFECSDERLNRIWKTGAYTVHLCMQDYIWDGVKRDRMVWIGDMHPETMIVSTVFGENPVIPSSLDYVRDRTPLPGWMNGISTYSIWWIKCQEDWFRYHGNLAYLEEQRDYLLALLKTLELYVGDDGGEKLDGHRFLDWPSSPDTVAINSGLQSLMVMGLKAGASLCRVLGEDKAAESAEKVAALAAKCVRQSGASKQANAMSVLAGISDPRATNEAVLGKDPLRSMSTFYGYYVLQARAAAGDYAGCLEVIRRFWGAMLDVGATTFWEHFELDWLANAGRIDELTPPGLEDLHADRGEYCYEGIRHSLCHGWAGGPTAWLTEHVLGLAPEKPGFESIGVDPHLADLEWARGTIPTPFGVVLVEHRVKPDGTPDTRVEAPSGVTVVLKNP